MNSIVQFPNSNVTRERYDKLYDNRTATCEGHYSLARAAGLRKYGYGNGFTVMDPVGSYIGNYPLIFKLYILSQDEN